MNHIKIPVGRSGFADIRNNGYYYIDKSRLIQALLKTEVTQVTLITRPRRFGKTLNMSMLSEFFDIRKNSRMLFDGLDITKDGSLCSRWMNQYPTLFLTLKNVDGLDFEGAYAQLTTVIAELYKKHFTLAESTCIRKADQTLFYKIATQKAAPTEIKNSILKLMQLLYVYYRKPVILLIDEYDVPLAKASEKGYYPQMLDVIKGMLQATKDNEFLKLAVITGCLRIAKESVFTGTNNFVADTISDARLDEYFGFTQAETDKLLADTGFTSHRSELKEWYDGYRFGDFDVYCPWDVMNHVSRLLINPCTKPASYWGNTSDNAIIRSFIDLTGSGTTKKIERLLSGGTIEEKIEDDLTYDYLHSSEQNLWSILYLTGYLTNARPETAKNQETTNNCVTLKIPNIEIRAIFEKTIQKWFTEKSREWDRQKLFTAVWNKNEEMITSEMTRLLRQTISYHDYKEDFYHAFFAGIFAGAGYDVESNKERGEGRSDIVVKDYAKDRAAVFEVKYVKTPDSLVNACEQAVRQIDARAYAEALYDDYADVICYGIAFYKKRCLVMCQKYLADSSPVSLS
ncbi:MAG: ATP-binding protein [Eubacterium sp.]|nr:ATP-binding protein [Eubacterium sp.]